MLKRWSSQETAVSEALAAHSRRKKSMASLTNADAQLSVHTLDETLETLDARDDES